MATKKKKKRPSRVTEEEAKSENESVVEETQDEDDDFPMQNFKIKVKTAKQLIALAVEGQEVFTTTEYIREDTNEIVCICVSNAKNIMWQVDPSDWAEEIAIGVWDTLEGEGQDPLTIDPTNDGWEFVAY